VDRVEGRWRKGKGRWGINSKIVGKEERYRRSESKVRGEC
jgi:hypothetical protein